MLITVTYLTQEYDASASCLSNGSMRLHHRAATKIFAWFDRDMDPQRIDDKSNSSPIVLS